MHATQRMVVGCFISVLREGQNRIQRNKVKAARALGEGQKRGLNQGGKGDVEGKSWEDPMEHSVFQVENIT